MCDGGSLPVPAGKTIKIAPDGFRIAFLRAKFEPMPGREIKGTLTFEKAGTHAVDSEVDDPQ